MTVVVILEHIDCITGHTLRTNASFDAVGSEDGGLGMDDKEQLIQVLNEMGSNVTRMEVTLCQ